MLNKCLRKQSQRKRSRAHFVPFNSMRHEMWRHVPKQVFVSLIFSQKAKRQKSFNCKWAREREDQVNENQFINANDVRKLISICLWRLARPFAIMRDRELKVFHCTLWNPFQIGWHRFEHFRARINKCSLWPDLFFSFHFLFRFVQVFNFD